MTQPLQTLLAAHPRTVAAIEQHLGVALERTTYDDEQKACEFRRYCHKHHIGRPWLDSIETLLDVIESKAAAEAPLSDAEIEGMKLEQPSKGCVIFRDTQKEVRIYTRNKFEADQLVAEFNARLFRLAAEIKRLRGGGK